MKILRILVIFAVISMMFQVAWAETDADRIQIRLHLSEGDTYYMKTMADMQMTLSGNGKHLDMVYRFGSGYSFNVEKVEKNGTSWSRVAFNSFYVKMTGLTADMEFDSTDSYAQPSVMMAATGGLVGEEFRVRMDDLGRIKKVDGVPEMVKRIVDHLQIKDKSVRDNMEKILNKSFKESSKLPQEGIEGIYTNKPLRIGDSWTSKSVVESNGLRMELNNTFVLKDCSNGQITIAILSPYKSMKASLTDGGSMELSSGIQEGTIVLDQNSGWIIREEIKNQFGGIIKVKNGEVPFSAEISCVTGPFDEKA